MERYLEAFIAPVGTRQNFSEDEKWYYPILQMRKLVCKLDGLPHNSNWKRLSRFWALASSDPRLLWILENRKRERGSLMILWRAAVLVQWYVSVMKGKTSSVIFTMVHFCTMTGPRGLNQITLSHCSTMAVSLRIRCLLLQMSVLWF